MLFAELRRRNVFKVATAYMIVGWVTLQIATLFFENFGAPSWVIRSFSLLIILGFPIACLLSWAFEATPEGMVRTTTLEGALTRRWQDYAWGAALLVTLLLAGANLLKQWQPPATPAVFETAVPAMEVIVQPEVRSTSIAVLPFVNMSADPEQEFFSDGLSEDILNGLVKLSTIKVVARTSSFSFKGKNMDVREIGDALDVTHVLEGSVRKVGNRVRITAQLIATADGTHVFSEQYDRELTDVFAVQDEVTHAILASLNQSFAPPANIPFSPTSNTEAYNALLQARHHFNRLEIELAMAASNRAIQLDPEYADAYMMRAAINMLAAWWGVEPAAEMIPLLHADTAKAASINPEYIGVRTMQAMLRFFVDGAHQEALDTIHQLFTSYPSEATVHIAYITMLHTIGQFDAAVELASYALKVDPLNPSAHRQLAEQLSVVPRLEEAEAAAMQAEGLGLEVATLLTQIYVGEENYDAAEVQLNRDLDAWGNAAAFREIFRAAVAYLSGDSLRAYKLLTALEESPLSDNPRAGRSLKLMLGDIDGAAEDFAYLMNEKDFYTIRAARGSLADRRNFPEFFEHPLYAQILIEAGLDNASVAKLRLPSLKL